MFYAFNNSGTKFTPYLHLPTADLNTQQNLFISNVTKYSWNISCLNEKKNVKTSQESPLPKAF